MKNYSLPTIGRVLACLFPLAILVPAHAQVSQTDEPVFELEAYNVYSSAQSSAAEMKRNSNTIGSFVGSDVIGDLPDDNLADALTRLPGVNVVNDDQVSIRGLEGKLNSIRLDGVDIAQAQSNISTSVGGDTRNFDVSAVPAEIVESVEVIKSITADLDADSIGGMVNVNTANAFNFPERVMRYKLEYRYNEEGNEPGYGASFIYGEAVSEKFGMYFNVSYRDFDSRDWKTEFRQAQSPDEIEIPELERVDVRERFNSEQRLVVISSFDWKLSERTQFFIKPYISHRERESFRNRVRLRDLDEREGNSRPTSKSEGVWWFEDGNGNPLGQWIDVDGDGVLGSAGDNFVPEGAIANADGKISDDDNVVITKWKQSADFALNRRQENRPERENTTYALTIGGETVTSDWQLEYKLSISQDKHNFIEDRSDWAQGSAYTDYQRFYYDNSDPYYPHIDVFEVTLDEGHVPVEPRVDIYRAHERIFLDALRLRDEDFSHDQMVGQIDYTLFNVADNWDLKMGAKIRTNDRSSRTYLWDYEPDFSFTFAEMSDYFGEDMGAHGGVYSYIGPRLMTNQPIIDLYNSNPGDWDRNDGEEFARQLLRLYDMEETISAAYMMATGHFGPFTLIGGLRVEKTDQDLTWSASQANLPSGVSPLSDVTNSTNYTNLFPSLLGIYRFGEKEEFVLRSAITTTLARPDYQYLIPFDTVMINNALVEAGSSDFEEIYLGNPNLKEQTSINYDVSFEWYANDSSSFSIGLFYKELEDFLMPQSISREVMVAVDPDDLDPGDPPFEMETVRSDFVVNGATREVKGMEMSWIQSLDMLPAPFDGFGFVFNYTYIEGEQAEPIFDEEDLADGVFNQIGVRSGQSLQGQPENILNLQAYYEKGPFNLRVAYNWVDQIKNEIFDVDFETFQESRGVFDASIQYKISKNMRLFLDVKNILEEDQVRIFQTTHWFPESLETDRREWVFGVRGQF